MATSHTLDQLGICFDDTDAGLLLAATLAERLRIGGLFDTQLLRAAEVRGREAGVMEAQSGNRPKLQERCGPELGSIPLTNISFNNTDH